MLNAIRTFTRDRRGAFAMQFALMAVPLCVCTGLAIDGGRAFLARFELASALDAAALAVGSTQDNEDVDLDVIARKFVEMNFKTQHDDPIALELVDLGGEDEAMVLRGSVAINTFFMPIVGQPYVTVEAESEVRRGGANVEVTLALDVTGSMNATRIAGLKAASRTLVDEVVSVAQTPFFSKVAIVPWSQSINLSTGTDDHVTAAALADLRGTPTAATGISAATWRNGATTTKTITAAGWRTNAGKTITNVAWRNGAALSTVTGITKTNSNTRIRIQTSANTGFTNGQTVIITGANGSYTGLNGNMYKVAGKTGSSPWYFWLQNVGTTTYTTPPAGSVNGTAGTLQRCLQTDCTVQVTSNSHGFVDGDLIFIENVNTSGVGLDPNNTWGETWVVDQRDGNNFTLNGTYGPDYAGYSSSGKASECYVADCRYRVTTSTTHDFLASDDLFIWGVTETGAGTSLNTATNSSINVESPSGTTFFLPGDSRNYMTWSSGGSVAECGNNQCNVIVTSANHGLATNDKVEIRNAAGLTGINTTSPNYWTVTQLTANTFRLNDSRPSMSSFSSAYTTGGTAQCLAYGCDKYWFLDSGDNPQIYLATDCIVERPGDEAYTETSPATAPLGILYSSNGACTQTNYVTPLTSNKTRLNDAIDDLSTGGSTAGQLGAAWAWYMLSPNFTHVWDKETENQAQTYETEDLIKVAVLMTDGEFNYKTCYGVRSSSLSDDNLAACDDLDPFEQAEAICENMKDAGITIYTVGLGLNTALYGDDFLVNCASNPQYAHLAADEAALQVAFKKIAQSISRLRISR